MRLPVARDDALRRQKAARAALTAALPQRLCLDRKHVAGDLRRDPIPTRPQVRHREAGIDLSRAQRERTVLTCRQAQGTIDEKVVVAVDGAEIDQPFTRCKLAQSHGPVEVGQRCLVPVEEVTKRTQQTQQGSPAGHGRHARIDFTTTAYSRR